MVNAIELKYLVDSLVCAISHAVQMNVFWADQLLAEQLFLEEGLKPFPEFSARFI